MVSLLHILDNLRPVPIMVIGDFMLDTYTLGKVGRISPEAPVIVLHVEHEESRLGGAGNVVKNLLALGCPLIPVGRVGTDAAGDKLLTFLQEAHLNTDIVVQQPGYMTPVKNRLIAQNQQIARVDFERVEPLPLSLETTLLERIQNALDQVQLVAISDYGKGLLSKSFLEGVIKQAKAKNIPVIVDPKSRDFSLYRGATVIKPNLHECLAARGVDSHDALEHIASRILQASEAEHLVVTRSQDGISLFSRHGEAQHFPIRVREVKDVTGAGDTVLALLSLACAQQCPLPEAIHFANLAAGIAVEHLGCISVSLPQIRERLIEANSRKELF